MHACVWFDKAPSTPIRIDFATGSHFDRCMYESGDSVSLKISRSGLSCTAIGHVTQEYDDGCNRAGGIWTLAYRGGGYAGDTASYWHTSPASDRTARCTLQKSTPWTDVCRSEEVCGNRDVRWSVYDEPDLWVVFKPEMDGKEELFKADIAGKDSNGDEKSLLVEAQRSPTPACEYPPQHRILPLKHPFITLTREPPRRKVSRLCLPPQNPLPRRRLPLLQPQQQLHAQDRDGSPDHHAQRGPYLRAPRRR
ncbi:uncharacterized protein BDZ99DRAFT_276386 [Mytilinidion resinicola]|uniref:Uncharacterized protein n=1 Tax=Mytilinidion resinicola TaxID=574789 RepID=A0A6A6YRR9_9PEZI|nr:uncharacterized protein BDZ99DRAFT_276386 [Mytilinidion resinicola]KAF2811500.1 hypothetical protein BDZ99DRAFT_276386 [Mytilinidion resinicola]